MIVLTGADCVLADRILSDATLVLDRDRIVDLGAGTPSEGSGVLRFHVPDHLVVPGFIDVHVHGVEGHDCLDRPRTDSTSGSEVTAVAEIARRLPRYGVTAFCPTTVACSPEALRTTLRAVGQARLQRDKGAARVLPAHLESNFINPDYRGAQPLGCIRVPSQSRCCVDRTSADFDSDQVLQEITRGAAEIAIVTLAPELDGAIALIPELTARGHRVSLGHSGASFDEAMAAVAAGARQATHLFNRMPPLHHRNPGLAGAVLASEEVVAEIICDGIHVHPAMIRSAIAAKQPTHILAITDGTALAGLPDVDRASLGGQPVIVKDGAARLVDGTLAGSTITMDRAFRFLVGPVGLSPVNAAIVCSTAPARALDLADLGVLAVGARADVVVLDRHLRVAHTFVDGVHVFGDRPVG